MFLLYVAFIVSSNLNLTVVDGCGLLTFTITALVFYATIVAQEFVDLGWG